MAVVANKPSFVERGHLRFLIIDAVSLVEPHGAAAPRIAGAQRPTRRQPVAMRMTPGGCPLCGAEARVYLDPRPAAAPSQRTSEDRPASDGCHLRAPARRRRSPRT